MIVEYHRPDNLSVALELLARSKPRTIPLAGGTVINRSEKEPEPLALVDLQALHLDEINREENHILIGAMVRLQRLLDEPGLSEALYKAIRHETSFNLRQMATVAGTLVSATGRSAFTVALLALDASLVYLRFGGGHHIEEKVSLGNVLPVRQEMLKGSLITQIILPLKARLAYEYVARTPADLPIVSLAAARWPSGRCRVAVGGYGSAPVLVLDGPESDGAELAAIEICRPSSDEWASGEYRSSVAGTLTRRCLVELEAELA